MSALLAVVSAVTSSPSPVPVQVVTQTVQVVPEWVNQLGLVLQQCAALGLLVVPGYLASLAHNFVNPKFGKFGNAALLYGYSIVLGLLGLVAANQLDLTNVDFSNPEVVGGAIFAVIGAATLQYNRWKANHAEVAPAASGEVAAQF